MRKTRKFLLFASDVALLYGALFLALFIRYGSDAAASQFFNHVFPFSALFIVWLAVFSLSDFYKYTSIATHFGLLKKTLQGIVTAGVLSVILLYLFPKFFELTPKTNLLLFAATFFVLNYAVRTGIFRAFSSTALRTALVGNSHVIEAISSYLSSCPHSGFRVSEYIRNTGTGTIAELESDRFSETDLFVVDGSFLNDESSTDIAYRLTAGGKTVMSASDFYESIFERIPLETLNAEWFLKNISPEKPFYEFLKRAFDLVLSVFLFAALLPLFAIIAVLVKFSSRGPVFFTQERAGFHGIPFTLIKFRTMKADAEKEGPRFAEKNDSRVTAFGKILRFTHLDEIPQLLNIAAGDLSFVGPRPERSVFVESFKKTIPYFEARNTIKPGLTGWAQINYKYSGNEEETRVKLSYDIFYLKNRSLVLDALILFRTIKTILFTPGT